MSRIDFMRLIDFMDFKNLKGVGRLKSMKSMAGGGDETRNSLRSPCKPSDPYGVQHERILASSVAAVKQQALAATVAVRRGRRSSYDPRTAPASGRRPDELIRS